MKLYHKTPCAECPWRKTSPQGYLGGWSAEGYADAVSANEVPACHLRDHGPDTDETAFCAGALGTIANACIAPHRAAGDGMAAKEAVGRNPDCFEHPAKFYEYHAGKPWVHPLMR